MSLFDQIEGASRRLLNPSGGCHNCPRRKINFVPATLAKGSILWLGEAPGKTDVTEQEGFVGDSGQFLRQAARKAGVPEPWSFSHAVHCQPESDAPKGKEIECCLNAYVLNEIKGYDFVVMVGSTPLNALFPGARATHFRGNFAYHPDFPGQRFYAIYHPSHVFRRKDLTDEFTKQIERLGRVARGEKSASESIEIIRGPESVDALRAQLVSPAVSLDLETTGAEVWAPDFKILSAGISADGRRVSMVHKDDPWFVAYLNELQKYLEQPANGVIGSHVAFDVECLEFELEFKAQISGIHEVQVIWYEAAQYKQASLKQLVAEQCDGYRHLVHRPHDPLWAVDVDHLLRYQAEDIAYSQQLFVKGMGKLKPRTQDLVVRAIGPMTMLYHKAQTHGIYIRQDYRKKKLVEYAEKRRAEVLAWQEEDPEFIPDTHESGKGLDEYLFDIKNLPVLAYTEKSQVAQVDKVVIKQWVRDGAKYLQHLLNIREIDKFVSTYLKGYDKHIDPRGRIHPNHWLTTTDTSRPSSTNPNVYNTPRNKEIRDMVGAPPGAVLVENDLSQIEFRIMVCRAKDENGIAGYMRGDDAHTMTAKTISGNPKPTKAQRSEAKPVNFALLYGGEWSVVQRQARDEFDMDWDEFKCRGFVKSFFATYPKIKVFHEDCMTRLIANKGWFESITGHIYHYEDWNSPDQGRRDHAMRAAINSEGQGPAANICYYIGVVARRLLDQRGFQSVTMVNSVYDSLMWEVPNPKWAPAVIETVDEASQVAHQWVKPWFVVPLIMEHAVGESWGSLEEVKK